MAVRKYHEVDIQFNVVLSVDTADQIAELLEMYVESIPVFRYEVDRTNAIRIGKMLRRAKEARDGS